MKTVTATALTAAALAGTAEGFMFSGPSAAHVQDSALRMSAAPGGRREFISKSAVSLAGVLGVVQGASAANYFGDKDAYPEVIKPADAVKDAELLGSGEIQGKVKVVQEYLETVRGLAKELEENSQADLRPKIRKGFEFAKLRGTLNDVNAVFDEDTQRGTDRIIRIILQDALEFDDAAKLKPGVPRTQRKIEIMRKKLAKLSGSFEDYLKFFSK